MKRVNEHEIKDLIANYYRKRNFTNETNQDIKDRIRIPSVSIDVEEMTERGVTVNCATNFNLTTYCSSNSSPDQYDVQFCQLLNFVNGLPASFCHQLRQLIYSVFINFVVDLVLCGHSATAAAFYTKHSCRFPNSHLSRDNVEALFNTTDRSQIATNKLYVDYRVNKPKLDVTAKVFGKLIEFLRSHNCLLLLKALNLQLDVTVNNDREKFSEINSNFEEIPDKSPLLERLRACSSKMTAGNLVCPTVQLYTARCSNFNINTSFVSRFKSRLIGGADDSSIRIYKLDGRPLEYTVDLQAQSANRNSSVDRVPSQPALEAVLRGHSGPVFKVCELDDQYFLSSSEDTSIRLWDATNGENKVVYQGHVFPVWDVVVSPLSIYFVSTSMDKTVRLWSPDRTFPLRIYAGHIQEVNCADFHPGLAYLASGSADRTVRLWSVHESTSVRVFTGHKSTIYCIAFSPNGQLLASSGEDRRLKIHDLRTSALLYSTPLLSDAVQCLAWAPDSSCVIGGDVGGGIHLWTGPSWTENLATARGVSIHSFRFENPSRVVGSGVQWQAEGGRQDVLG